MDGRQLARDLRGGLLQLTIQQFKAVRSWVNQGGTILAVGDILPLLMAWLSGAPYAFVGTAKSEYYLRDERGFLPKRRWEGWSGSIYQPWERWLMSRPRCWAIFPRDTLTTTILLKWSIPAFDLGNPMMDGLDVQGLGSGEWGVGNYVKAPNQKQIATVNAGTVDSIQNSKAQSAADANKIQNSLPADVLTIALLPGSRPPEAYENWETILLALNGLIAEMGRPLSFLAAIAPGLNLDLLHQELINYRWQQIAPQTYAVGLGEQRAELVLTQTHFAECLHRADLAIAMAGTATEQFVGLGKPAITISGKGPQFTPAFAEAQTRLLGPSVTLVTEPTQATTAIKSLLQDPDRLSLIVQNGRHRMGEPGAAKRIAACLMERLQ
jgi:hypothetical protein